MDIFDIISWLPERELSLDQIRTIVSALYEGKTSNDRYNLEMVMPKHSNDNVINMAKDLQSEGRRVCYLLRDNTVIAVIGYKIKD